MLIKLGVVAIQRYSKLVASKTTVLFYASGDTLGLSAWGSEYFDDSEGMASGLLAGYEACVKARRLAAQ